MRLEGSCRVQPWLKQVTSSRLWGLCSGGVWASLRMESPQPSPVFGYPGSQGINSNSLCLNRILCISSHACSLSVCHRMIISVYSCFPCWLWRQWVRLLLVLELFSHCHHLLKPLLYPGAAGSIQHEKIFKKRPIMSRALQSSYVG